MLRPTVEFIVRHKGIIPVVVALAAIGAYIVPSNLALGQGSHGSVSQSISQHNTNFAINSGTYGGAFADFVTQTNTAHNTANVHVSSSSSDPSANVIQSIDQHNTNFAINTGSGTSTSPTSASASNNIQSNDAHNTANVHVSSSSSGHGKEYKGGSGSSSASVSQSISQHNTNFAINTGTSGSASASNNVQTNTAHNTANVHVSSSNNDN